MNKSVARFRTILSFRFKATLAGFAAMALSAHALHAQTLTFDGTGPNNATQTGTWTTATATTDWNTASDGSGTTTFWTNGDDAHFSVSGATTPTTTSTVTMGTAVSANSLNFDVGATTITSGTDAITVAAGGINIASGASGSVGNANAASGITTTVSQTWTNNSATAFVDGGGSVGGGTTLNAGLILATGNFQLGNTGQNNLINGGGSITVDTGATLTADGSTSALASHPVYLNGGTISSLASKSVSGINAFLDANSFSSVGGASGTPMASLALDGNYTLTADAGSYMVVNVIKNGASGTTLTLAGPSSGTTLGQVALNGTSTFTGTTVTLGTLSALSLGAGSTGGDINTGAGAGFTGGIISNSGVVAFNHSTAYTFNGHITGTGGVTNIAGTTTLTDGTDDYSGVTTASGGTLSATTLANGLSASSIGASSNAAANLVLETSGTFQYSGSGGSTDRLFTLFSNNGIGMTLDASGTGAINFTNTGSLSVTGGKGFTFGLTGSSTANNTLAPKIVNYNGSNVTSVSKTGTGTWILTNANTYSGTTSITGGMLLVNGTHTTAGAYTVAGGTLGGLGTINTGATTISIGNGTTGGTITGGAVGTVGMLTLTTTAATGVVFNGASASLSTYAVDLSTDGSTSDNLKINGALTLTGAYDHITVTGTPTAASFDLINYTGTSLTSGFTEAAGDLPTGYALAYNSDEIDLIAVAVPEPSTWAACFLGFGLTCLAMKKRGSRRG